MLIIKKTNRLTEFLEQEILDYGFLKTDNVKNDIHQQVYEKPFSNSKSNKIFCRIILNWVFENPLLYISTYLIEYEKELIVEVVNGYEILLPGDFTVLVARLTINLESIQKHRY